MSLAQGDDHDAALGFRTCYGAFAGGYLTQAVPVFIPAIMLNPQKPLIQVIASLLRTPSYEVERLLWQGHLWLLIDGINELEFGVKRGVQSLLREFLAEYNGTALGISSRKYRFDRFLRFPVFELLPLEDQQIREYLLLHIPSEHDRANVYQQLEQSSFVREILRTPLMLHMLMRVMHQGQVPRNRGQLFRMFTRWMLSREAKTTLTDAAAREVALAVIAFGIRQNGGTDASETLVSDWVERALHHWRGTISVRQVLDELRDSRLLIEDDEGNIRFWHELFLEYFAAIVLRREYLRENREIHRYVHRPEWFEVLQMLAGLVTNVVGFIERSLPFNIVLAARCISSGRESQEDGTGYRVHCKES